MKQILLIILLTFVVSLVPLAYFMIYDFKGAVQASFTTVITLLFWVMVGLKS